MATESELPELGSLAQSVRTKQLKTARVILFAVGLLTIAVNGYFFTTIEDAVDELIQKELAAAGMAGMVVDQQALAEVRDGLIRTNKLVTGGAIAVGVLYILFGVFIYRLPVPITITSLVLYIGTIAFFGYWNPMTLWQGWLVKILIIVGLFKAIQAAIAHENEKKQGFADSREQEASAFGAPPQGELGALPLSD
jgi:predicted RND superfamily exporter protein